MTPSWEQLAASEVLNKLLVYYQALLKSFTHQAGTSELSTPGSPFKDLKPIFSEHTK